MACFEKRVVSADINRTTGATSNVMCSDTLPNSNGKEGGTPRLCAGADGRYGTADDAPQVYLGRSVPPREFSFNGNLTLFNRLHVFSMLDVKNGHKKIDGNTRARCGIFGRCKENFPATFAAEIDPLEPRRPTRAATSLISSSRRRTSPVGASSRSRTTSPSACTTFGRFNRANIAVSGRNLGLWTSYQGFEPEAMFLGGTRGGNIAFEQTTLPQLRTWIVFPQPRILRAHMNSNSRNLMRALALIGALAATTVVGCDHQ